MEQITGTEEKKPKESTEDIIKKRKEALKEEKAGLEELLSLLDAITESSLSYPFYSLEEAFAFGDKSGLTPEEMLTVQMNRCLGISSDPDDKVRERSMDTFPWLAALKKRASQAREAGEYEKVDKINCEIIRTLEEENARLNKRVLNYSNL